MQNIAMWIDIVLGFILVLFMFRGAKNGFSGEIVGLVGLIVAIFSAFKFQDPALELFYKFVPAAASYDKTIMEVACSVVIFLAVEIIFAIIGGILSYVVRVTRLSLLDHFCGMGIGFIKGCGIILVVYLIATSFKSLFPSEWIENSNFMNIAAQVWPMVRDFLESTGAIDLSSFNSSASNL
ncbi:MAG: CvpA family protein [Synergistaceae bacterium]|nr:CvpA family protein [Synergistaceae bacterium]